MPRIIRNVRRPWQPEKKAQEGRKYRDPRYDTPRWRKLRAYGLKLQPLCVECEKEGKVTQATVRDHIKPVSQGGSFWSMKNQQSLCSSCHNKKSGKEAWKK